MSQLNIGLSDFGHPRAHVRDGISLRKSKLHLRALVRAILSTLNSGETALIAQQSGQVVTDATSDTCAQDNTLGCKAHVTDAEYQHLVDLGQWHHRRQRRRARMR